MSDWKQQLADLFKQREQRQQQRQLNEQARLTEMPEAMQWLDQVVIPAFNALKAELGKYGREITISKGYEDCLLSIRYERAEDFTYRVLVSIYATTFAAIYEVKAGNNVEYQGSLARTLKRSANEITQDAIILSVVEQYTRYIASL